MGGKSTALTRLTDVSNHMFPRASTLTTCPLRIRIQMRRGPEQPPLLWIENTLHEPISISSFLPIELISSLHLLQTPTNLNQYEIGNIQQLVSVLQTLMSAISNMVNKPATNEYEIFVRLYKPDLLPIDVVDLPGLDEQ